jgi:hypothetical protein
VFKLAGPRLTVLLYAVAAPAIAHVTITRDSDADCRITLSTVLSAGSVSSSWARPVCASCLGVVRTVRRVHGGNDLYVRKSLTHGGSK